MAENLLWMARDHHANRKIIVWAASIHVARNPGAIERITSTVRSYHGWTFMGEGVYAGLGERAYTIACTAYQGSARFLRQKPFELFPASRSSLESLCHDVGAPYLFIDLRGARATPGQWPAGPQVARPLGFAEQRADWSTVFDGIFYIDTMAAANWNN